MTSEKKIAANRINGRKSHGPKDTTLTRHNATKHGLLATGITELDDAEWHRTLLDNLKKEKNPVGVVEMFLVESAAMDMLRWPRARRFEAEFITGELHPPILEAGPLAPLEFSQPIVVDPGLPAPIGSKSAQPLVSVFQRYESTFAYRLFRTLHELERLQRMRQGDTVPVPATVDINVHADTGIVGSVPAESEQRKALPGDQK
jgi:hypothetical protein